MWINCPRCRSQYDGAEPKDRGTPCPVCMNMIYPQDIHPNTPKQPAKPITKPLEEHDSSFPSAINPSADTIEGTEEGVRSLPVAQDVSKLVFGDYEILKEINRGAMGIVYKARQKTLNRIVAIKVLIAGEHASKQQIARFRREALAIARLRHPNIVPVHEISEYRGKHYFTMDYISGASLSTLIKEGTIQPKRALQIITQLSDALQYAHNQGVIHRDVKPGNIMIDSLGRPLLMDFGLAKQIDTGSRFTRSGTTIGTPAYMPPEQARGDLDAINRQSDVYSLGAVLYEMLSGQPPFVSENMLDVIMKVINEDPPPPRLLNPKIHRDIQTIILKCMEKEPEKRYQTALEFQEDLLRYEAGESIKARPPGKFAKVFRFVYKSRVAAAAFFMIGSILLLATSALYHMYRHYEITEAIQKAKEKEIKLAAENRQKWELITSANLAKRKNKESILVSNAWDWAERLAGKDGKINPEDWGASNRARWKTTENEIIVQPQTILRKSTKSKGLCKFEFQAQLKPRQQLRQPPQRRTPAPTTATPTIVCFLNNPGLVLRYEGNELTLLQNNRPVYRKRVSPLEWEKYYDFSIERTLTGIEISIKGQPSEKDKAAKPHITALHYADLDLLNSLKTYQVGFETVNNAGELHLSKLSLKTAQKTTLPSLLIKGDTALLNGGRENIEEAQGNYEAVIKESNNAKEKTDIAFVWKKMKILAMYRLGLCLELSGKNKTAAEQYEKVWTESGNFSSEFATDQDLIEINDQLRKEAGLRIFFCLGQEAALTDPSKRNETYQKAMSYLEKITDAGKSQLAEPNPWIAKIPSLIIQPMPRNNQFSLATRCFELIKFPAEDWIPDLDQLSSQLYRQLVGNWTELKRLAVAHPNEQVVQNIRQAFRRSAVDNDKIDMLSFVTERYKKQMTTFDAEALQLANVFANSKESRVKMLDLMSAFPSKSLKVAIETACGGALRDNQIELLGKLLSDGIGKSKLLEHNKALDTIHLSGGQAILKQASNSDVFDRLVALDNAYLNAEFISLFESVAKNAYATGNFDLSLSCIEHVYERWNKNNTGEKQWETPTFATLANAIAEELSVYDPLRVISVFEKFPSQSLKDAFIRTIDKIANTSKQLSAGRQLLKTLRIRVIPSAKVTAGIHLEEQSATLKLAELHYSAGEKETDNFFHTMDEIQVAFRGNKVISSGLDMEIGDLSCFDTDLTEAEKWYRAAIKNFGRTEDKDTSMIRLAAVLIERELETKGETESTYDAAKSILIDIITAGAKEKSATKSVPVMIARIIMGEDLKNTTAVPKPLQEVISIESAKKFFENELKNGKRRIHPAEWNYYLALRNTINYNIDAAKEWRIESIKNFDNHSRSLRFWPYSLIKRQIKFFTPLEM